MIRKYLSNYVIYDTQIYLNHLVHIDNCGNAVIEKFERELPNTEYVNDIILAVKCQSESDLRLLSQSIEKHTSEGVKNKLELAKKTIECLKEDPVGQCDDFGCLLVKISQREGRIRLVPLKP